MIVAISRFKTTRDEAEVIAARFRTRSRLVDQHDGFLGLEVLKSPGGSPEFLLITRWASRDALKAYLKSQDFRAVHKDGEEQEADFMMYEQVAT